MNDRKLIHSYSSRRSFLKNITLGSLGTLIAAPMLGFGHTQPSLSVSEEVKEWSRILGKEVYGAKADSLGSIGGGLGYKKVLTEGNITVKNLKELLSAISTAKSGEVIFIPGNVHIDLTTAVYIDKLVLQIPAGITLASDRGYNGSEGAIITSDALATPVLFKIMGEDVRFTGLRIQGPNPKRYLEHHADSFSKGGKGSGHYYKFPVSRGITTEFGNLEVDNCDISAFSGASIYLIKGNGHHIHHNFIHKCQYNGLGYGVSHNFANSIIESNFFNENRHSIAGTGAVGSGYIARNNVELGVSLSHCFDMHGGRDRGDGTNIAGARIEVYNNTFLPTQSSVVIRGVPEDACLVHHNWFVSHESEAKAVRGEEKTETYNNAYGKKPEKAL